MASETLRCDIEAPVVPEDDLMHYRKFRSEVKKETRKLEKPEACYICGSDSAKFCKSHSIPRFCLGELAVEGKLLTAAYLFESNLFTDKVGVGEALTFKAICQKCDTEFFKKYETPTTLLERPDMQVLGQIAAKNLLREISKARHKLALREALGAEASSDLGAAAAVRQIDLEEDMKAFRVAKDAGRRNGGGVPYEVVFYKVLPYVAPIAFQQMISPVADFDGELINNCFNPNPRYKMEPLHVCVLPLKGNTAVLAFHSKRAKRYRRFRGQLKDRDLDGQLLAFVKLLFAYSEDILISPRIEPIVRGSAELASLARMNRSYLCRSNDPRNASAVSLQACCADFAVDDLPSPPNLLLPEYAI